MENSWFTIDEDHILTYCSSEACGEIVIPDGVKGIGEKAFCRCTAITAISIPDSVEYIAEDAFDDCSENIKKSIEEWRTTTAPCMPDASNTYEVGSVYSMTSPFAKDEEFRELLRSVTDTIREKADKLDFDLFDRYFVNVPHLQGTVVYNNGTTAIIKVSTMIDELALCTISFETLRSLFPDYEEEHPDETALYYCVDVKTDFSLFEEDPFTKEETMARFDENHEYIEHSPIDETDKAEMIKAALFRKSLKPHK